MGNKLEVIKIEVELESLLAEYHNIRINLEKSINEIIEYAKIFEKSANPDKVSCLKTSKKDIDIGEA